VAVYLVCESSDQGLDRRVLEAVVVQFHNLTVLIEATGGMKGHGAVRDYLESRSQHDVAISIQDRDYRPAATANTTWANPTGRNFIWRKHEIENYLVHPRVVYEAFQQFGTIGAAWVSSLPATENDASALLQNLAGPLLENHAAEVLREELVRQINVIGSLSFGPARPAPPAGSLARGQTQWVPALQTEASRLCQTCSAVAALPDLQAAAIATRYSSYLNQFQNPAFLSSGNYLVEMEGKGLLAALTTYLASLGAPARLNQHALADELLKALERVYQPNSIFQPDFLTNSPLSSSSIDISFVRKFRLGAMLSRAPV
jgi:hypothetical protein